MLLQEQELGPKLLHTSNYMLQRQLHNIFESLERDLKSLDQNFVSLKLNTKWLINKRIKIA